MRPIGLLVVIALSAPPLEAQDAWLAEVPTAAKVVEDYQASGSRLGSARAAAALYSLTNLIGSLSGASFGPAAQARVAELLATKEAVLTAQAEKDRDRYQVGGCQAMYQESPEFHRELLDHFFTAQWIATYGPKLDPRRWKPALALPAGARPTTILSPECGAAPVVAVRGNEGQGAKGKETRPAGPGHKQLYAGAVSLNAGDSAAALTSFREAARLDPSNPTAYRIMGYIHFGHGSYDSALVHFSTVLALSPDDFLTRSFLGRSHRMLGRHAEALEALRKSIPNMSDPRMLTSAHYAHAMSSLSLGQRDAAMESWRALSALDTSSARKVAEGIKKGDAQKAVGEAAATASQAAALEAEGVRYMQAKDYKRARAAFHAALKIDPARPTTLYQLGVAWFEAADVEDTTARRVAWDLAWDSAEVAWKRAVELKPSDAKLLVAIGDKQRRYYAELGTDAYVAALELKPDVATAAQAYTGLGWISRYYGFYKQCVDDLGTATRLDYRNTEAVYGLGLCFARLGMKPQAMAQYRKLVALKEPGEAKSLLEAIEKKE
jgi:tetratricopeptide (TPR) repeat protein